MSTEFSKMTNEELKRWMADRLGYKLLYTQGTGLAMFTLISPDGHELGKPKSVADLCFQYAPDWPTSVDAALALPRYGYRLGMLIGHMSEATFDDLARTFRATTDIDNPARAICEAWCQMMESDALSVADKAGREE